MVEVRSVAVSDASPAAAVRRFAEALDGCALDPSFVFLFYGSAIDDDAVYAALRERFPAVPLIGGTSCSGIMSDRGLGEPASIGALIIEDRQGDYGSAAGPLGNDPAAAARDLLGRALAAAGCPGELPELIWIYQSPGHEEAVIEGLRRVVGDRCPIVGGTAADDRVAGEWRQLGPEGPLRDGLVVAVLFSTGGIGFAFQGGYEPTGVSGVVTRVAFDPSGHSGIATATEGRHILAIDGRPAAEIYNEWLGGTLGEQLDGGGSILADTTLCPIAFDSGVADQFSHYLLVHPAEITPELGLTTFATVTEGTRVHAMRGDRQRLIDRAGRVSAAAVSALQDGAGTLAGGLVVYCGGCRMAVGDEMPQVAEAVRQAFGDGPFLGCFTFGEQGSVLGRNVHGNLMISAIAFGR